MVEQVESETITVINTSPGLRYVWMTNGQQAILRPGESAEVTVHKNQADSFRKYSAEGTSQGLIVKGSEPPPEAGDNLRAQQLACAEIEALERKNFEAVNREIVSAGFREREKAEAAKRQAAKAQ